VENLIVGHRIKIKGGKYLQTNGEKSSFAQVERGGAWVTIVEIDNLSVKVKYGNRGDHLKVPKEMILL